MGCLVDGLFVEELVGWWIVWLVRSNIAVVKHTCFL